MGRLRVSWRRRVRDESRGPRFQPPSAATGGRAARVSAIAAAGPAGTPGSPRRPLDRVRCSRPVLTRRRHWARSVAPNRIADTPGLPPPGAATRSRRGPRGTRARIAVAATARAASGARSGRRVAGQTPAQACPPPRPAACPVAAAGQARAPNAGTGVAWADPRCARVRQPLGGLRQRRWRSTTRRVRGARGAATGPAGRAAESCTSAIVRNQWLKGLLGTFAPRQNLTRVAHNRPRLKGARS